MIKGRGLRTVEQYQAVGRAGREGVALGPNQRADVWTLFYEPYQARLAERGIVDFNDVISQAVAELRDRPLDDSEDYALVVVDEVQDFTLLELTLVHHIAGGGPEAQLLLVGDGQQQVYAGGCKLSEAGIPFRVAVDEYCGPTTATAQRCFDSPSASRPATRSTTSTAAPDSCCETAMPYCPAATPWRRWCGEPTSTQNWYARSRNPASPIRTSQ
ncbi:UvrD-helicase domain-containing protein [Nocardia wallacei]|uniref:UvrD-helicase domain-containing protein n=1 Tax=Nocardia wallacei TaxID=480035 RepID=UPI0024548096|nr:UvrD-helicase domain-containing protein [Nocardia wallacei]